MDAFTNSLEITRLVFLTGAVFATLYKRKTGVTPGGIIVPAFLTLALDKSILWFASLIAIALLTRMIYRLFIESFAFPRNKVVLLNIGISTLLVMISQVIFSQNTQYAEMFAYGLVIPGLIASNSQTYGLVPVLYGSLFVTAITSIVGYIYVALVPFQLATQLSVKLSEFSPLVIGHHLLVSVLSLIAAFFVITIFKVKAGGYVIAPIVVTLLLTSALQFALYGLAVVACYWLLNIILRHSLIIGLERFLLCLLLSAASVTLIDLLALQFHFTQYFVSPTVYMTAMAVVLNDLCLSNIQKIAGTTSRFAALTHSKLYLRRGF